MRQLGDLACTLRWQSRQKGAPLNSELKVQGMLDPAAARLCVLRIPMGAAVRLLPKPFVLVSVSALP